MKASILSLVPVFLAANALAGRMIDKRTHNRLDSRDDREECTKDMVADFWKYGKPPGTTAAICYKHDFRSDIGTTSSDHYKYIASRKCTQFTQVVGNVDVDYDCFYLIGANTFEALDDGGYDNLAIQYDPKKCTWADKKLACRA